MIDSHCHLQLCKEPVDDILNRARGAGLDALVQVATDVAAADFGIELASREGLPLSVFPTAGLYPSRAEGDWQTQIPEIERRLQHPRVVALGEVGIDLYHDKTYLDRQVGMLEAQIELAQRYDKTMIFHIRNSFEEVLSVLSQYGEGCPQGVWHCFEGTADQARVFVEKGWMISFSGLVTYKKNDEIREVASWVPSDQILIETDSPYLAPDPRRGKVNEPAFLRYLGQFAARLFDVSEDFLAEKTFENTCDFYGI